MTATDNKVASKPKNVNNFSVLMDDAGSDVEESPANSSAPQIVSPVKPAMIGAGSFASKVSFASASVSPAPPSAASGGDWQTKTKPAPTLKQDGMYRGSSSTLLNRTRPAAPAQPQQQAPGQGQQQHGGHPRSGVQQRPPRPYYTQNLPMIPERTIELYDFPAALRTEHLHSFVATVDGVQGHYRLKWQNDTSCFVITESPVLAERLLAELSLREQDTDGAINVRAFHPDNVVKAASASEQQ